MNIILHEGKDDKKYIKRICTHLEIKVTDENFYELASPEKPYDYNHKNFNDIKEKLQELFA